MISSYEIIHMGTPGKAAVTSPNVTYKLMQQPESLQEARPPETPLSDSPHSPPLTPPAPFTAPSSACVSLT